jgi:hypothetical protein
LRWFLASHHDLDARAPTYDGTLDQDRSIRNLMKLYTRAAGLRFAIANSTQFGPFSIKKASAELDSLNSTIEGLAKEFQTLTGPDAADRRATFVTNLQSIADKTQDAPHRSHLYTPLINTPGEHLIAFFSDEYPVALAQTGAFGLAGQDLQFACPSRCMGSSYILFRNRAGAQVGRAVEVTVNTEVKVPANTYAYFIIKDLDIPPGYSDNEWIHDNGILSYELME